MNIQGKEKIEKCSGIIKQVVAFYYARLKEKDMEMIITSGYRENDEKMHGQGKAVDVQVPGVHVLKYAPILLDAAHQINKNIIQLTSFGFYEGIKDGRWTTHVHTDYGAGRDFMSVYSGKY